MKEKENNFGFGKINSSCISYYLETKKILKTIILKGRPFDANVSFWYNIHN